MSPALISDTVQAASAPLLVQSNRGRSPAQGSDRQRRWLRVGAHRPLSWPFLTTALVVLCQGLWLALVTGTPCNDLWSWTPFILALGAGFGEAAAAWRRRHRWFGVALWGISLTCVTTVTGFIAGYAAASAGGCFS